MAQLDQNLSFFNEIKIKNKNKKAKNNIPRKEKKPLNCPPCLLIQQNTPHPHTIIMFPYLPFCNHQIYSHLHLFFFVSKQLCGLFGLVEYFKKIRTNSNLSYKKLLTFPIHPFTISLAAHLSLFLSSLSLSQQTHLFLSLSLLNLPEIICSSSICIC